MPIRASEETRAKILESAERLVLAQGFSATSIDQIIAPVGLTKGAFFHHFRSKNDLARALIESYWRQERELMTDLAGRSAALAGDPVQRLLVFLGLFQELAGAATEPSPGCLYASFCYESGLFDDQTMGVAAGSILAWRELLGGMIRDAVAHTAPRRPVDPEELADMFTALAEGAVIISRMLQDRRTFARQIGLYRQYLELLLTS
jgi:TetR/AcrR family transcriptional regulator, transcriptional repressor for nem operon